MSSNERPQLYTISAFGTIRQFLLAILIFKTISPNNAAPLPQLSDLIRARPHVFYTIARQYDNLEFMCRHHNQVLFWVLPNNELVEPNQSNDTNKIVEFRQSKIVITPHSLQIPEIETGFDGRYSCLLEDGERFDFYVLQVSPRVDFTKASVLSITVAIGLALICLTVIFLDKYCSRPGAAIRPVTMRPVDQAAADPMILRLV
ncbi:hypothetical protein M3Y97_00873100 [Aphelenchoides bicaudatus]|nr:hypothetical protein M3Y97_00873100 [Aphelenchoides bicaudatus]